MRITPFHVLVFATSYGCVSVFTRAALDEGAGSATVLLMRGLGSAVLLWVALVLAGREWRLPARERNRSLAIGLVLAAGNFCMVEAVREIPVPIAVLILYTFPILTALASAMLGREPLTGRMLVALVMAFAGLAIIVHARIDEYTWRSSCSPSVRRWHSARCSSCKAWYSRMAIRCGEPCTCWPPSRWS